jgi:hypothetical protein
MPPISYYDVDGVEHAACPTGRSWTRWPRSPIWSRHGPDRVEVTLDGERLELEPGQTVVAHGIDRNLSIGEAGALTHVLDGAGSGQRADVSRGQRSDG